MISVVTVGVRLAVSVTLAMVRGESNVAGAASARDCHALLHPQIFGSLALLQTDVGVGLSRPRRIAARTRNPSRLLARGLTESVQ